MDFGDILKQWDSGNYQDKKKVGKTSSQIAFEKKVHPMDAWLRQNKVIDKDAALTDEPIDAAENRRRLKRKKPDDSIDIHGLTHDEAWLALDNFFKI